MDGECVIGGVSAGNVRKHVEHITAQIPSRLAGSENGRRMAEYSLQVLCDTGLPAEMHETLGLVSFPERPSSTCCRRPRW